MGYKCKIKLDVRDVYVTDITEKFITGNVFFDVSESGIREVMVGHGRGRKRPGVSVGYK